MTVQTANVKQLLQERAERQGETLRLYRPQPKQEIFHRLTSTERAVIGGNRSGKSFASAAEFAHAATGIPIIGADGKPLPDKYDRSKPMILWCIGLGEDHIGQTLFRLLFTNSSGMRKIRDKETGEWRCYDPSNEDDVARKAESKPAGPLIPPRLIDRKGWAWENKALRVFEKCTLTNGNVIYAFSSRADAKQGDSVDLIWIDEDIADPGDYTEWRARILQAEGRIIWSAFPHCQNDALLKLNERAIKQEGTVRPVATRVVLTLADTKYVSKQAQADFLDGLTDDEKRARMDGEFVMDQVMVYPSFSKYIHAAPAQSEEMDDPFDHAIRENRGEPLKNWTRYLMLDPGHTQAAVLFAAVPPPSLGNVVYLYDELYPKHMTAPEMARILYERLSGLEVRAFIMDWHAGRQTVMGYGKTIYQIYSEAFAKQQLRSTVTGCGFAQGSDNILGGIEIVRNMLKLQDHGRPVLRVNVDKCPNLCHEFSRYRKKVGKHATSDEPIQANNHLMDCLRYGVLYGLNYQLPTLDVTTGADKVWLSWWRLYGERAQREKAESGIYVGAGAIA